MSTATPAYDDLSPRQRRWVDEYFLNGLNQSAASRAVGVEDKDVARHGSRMARNGKVRAAIDERLAEAGIGVEEVLFLWSEHARASADLFVSFREAERPRYEEVPVAEAVRRTALAIEEAEAVLVGAPHSKSERKASEAQLRELGRQRLRYEHRAALEPDAVVTVEGEPERYLEPYVDLDKTRRLGKMHLVKTVDCRADGTVRVELHDRQAALTSLARALGMFTDRVDLTTGGKPLEWFRDSTSSQPS